MAISAFELTNSSLEHVDLRRFHYGCKVLHSVVLSLVWMDPICKWISCVVIAGGDWFDAYDSTIDEAFGPQLPFIVLLITLHIIFFCEEFVSIVDLWFAAIPFIAHRESIAVKLCYCLMWILSLNCSSSFILFQFHWNNKWEKIGSYKFLHWINNLSLNWNFSVVMIFWGV